VWLVTKARPYMPTRHLALLALAPVPGRLSEVTGNLVDNRAKSMRNGGFVESAEEPIKAFLHDGALFLRDGHHRTAGAIRAGSREVPAMVTPVGLPEDGAQLFREWAATLDDRRF
jgi:ParB-like chromosome segregation protein Spo0J